MLLTTYDRLGYRVTEQAADSLPTVVEPARLPLNLVNPPRRRWEVVNLDTVRFTRADSVAQSGSFRRKRYAKVPNLVNVHSWMPLAFNPFAAVDEHVIDANLGVTLLSQNLLSNTEAYLSYGWNGSEGSLFNLGVRYTGLGVQFDLDASYGGNQLFYSLASYDPVTGSPVYQSRPAPDKYYSVGLTATLPIYMQRGYHTRQLSVWTGWNYSNGMVADLDKIEWVDGGIHNIQRVGFRKGLHKLSVGVGFADQVRMAHRDLAPRWGYSLSAAYTCDPVNLNFSDLISFYGMTYLPGAAPHHSLQLAATFQTSVGGYKFPSGYAPLSYKSTQLIPRGFSSSEIVSNDYTAARINYQLPLCYPEGGIGSVLYIKRIRLAAGGDYAQFPPSGSGRHAVAEDLVGGRRSDLRHQCLPSAGLGDGHLQALVLPSFDGRSLDCRLARAAVLIFSYLCTKIPGYDTTEEVGHWPEDDKMDLGDRLRPVRPAGPDACAHGARRIRAHALVRGVGEPAQQPCDGGLLRGR